MLARRFSKPTVAATVAATVYVIACGGGGGGKVVDSGIKLIDSTGGGQMDGSAAGTCNAMASYGAANFTMQVAGTKGSGTTGSNAHFEEWDGLLNADPDALVLELYAGFGGFGSGDIRPGTYQLTGSDAQYASCGICLRLFTDLTGSGSQTMAKDQYFATGGSITLTTTTGSNFSASLSNVTMTHVTIGSDFTSTPVGDCNSAITSGTMQAPLQAAFTGQHVQWSLPGRHR